MIILIVFILCKIPHLFYPFFWDESWPYEPAIMQMYHNGISLLPNAIDPDLSRGHPLFLHATAAIWMKIFGPSHVSQHSYALFVSVLFLVSIYEVGFGLFSKRVAVLATLLVASQVVFFVQSSFLLPEILVAFLAFISIYFYVKEKYVFTAVSLSALFFTKESGMIAGFVIGLSCLFELFDNKKPTRSKIYSIISIGIPVLLIGCFFLLQKHLRGWYFSPVHMVNMVKNWGEYWNKFRMGCVSTTFVVDFRYYYFYIVLLLAVIAAIKNKNIRYLVLFIPAIIIYYWVDDTRAGRIPSRPSLILFISSIIYTIYLFKKIDTFQNGYQFKFVFLVSLFCIFFLCFSAANAFSYRYILASIVPLLFVIAVLIDKFTDQTYKFAVYPVFTLVLFIGCWSFAHNNGLGDADLGAFRGMEVYQGLVDYLVANNDFNKSIAVGNFQNRIHLTDPNTGYLNSGKTFPNSKWEIDSTTQIAVFDNIEPDYRYDTLKAHGNYKLVYRIQKGIAWGEIYERRK
jgi:hypothetical protein